MWKDAQGYWRFRKDGVQVKIHRYVWELYNGPIPEGYDVHHGDGKGNFDGEGNKNCNCIVNLKLMKHEDHLRLHALTRSVDTQQKITSSLKGRIVTEETRKKIRDNNTGWKPSAEMVERLRFAKIKEGIKKSNKTGYKGVWWDSDRNKYQAYIKPDGKRIFLGRFDTPEAAAFAYDEAAKKCFGSDCFLNFPQDNLTEVHGTS